MSFKTVYETNVKSNFDDVRQKLDAAHIPHERLYEYRLVSEKHYDQAGVGGEKAIIRVAPKDYNTARSILVDAGYLAGSRNQHDQFAFVTQLDVFLARIPVIGNLSTPYKLLSLLFAGGGILLFTVFYVHYNNWNELDIVGRRLMIKSIKYGEDEVLPESTNRFTLKGINNTESIQFRHSNPRLLLPGINSDMVVGDWYFSIEDNDVVIFGVDRFSEIYNGAYRVERNFWKSEIKMTSATTEFVLFID